MGKVRLLPVSLSLSLCLFMYVCIYIYTYIITYINIYIEREGERDFDCLFKQSSTGCRSGACLVFFGAKAALWLEGRQALKTHQAPSRLCRHGMCLLPQLGKTVRRLHGVH